MSKIKLKIVLGLFYLLNGTFALAGEQQDDTFKEISKVCARIPVGVPRIAEAFKQELTGVALPSFDFIKNDAMGPFNSIVEVEFEKFVNNKIVVFYNSFVKNKDTLATAKEDQIVDVTDSFSKMMTKDCRLVIADELIPGYEKLN